MKARLALPALLLLTVPGFAVEAGSTAPASISAAAFARLKSLVGQWEGQSSMGKFHITFNLVSGGHVLEERLSSDAMHENMLTTYYLNGDSLELRHYCELGNVPHMVARKIDLQNGEIGFEFADAANLASDQNPHMHEAAIKLIDADHFSGAWTMFENAKPKFTVAVQYQRVQ